MFFPSELNTLVYIRSRKRSSSVRLISTVSASHAGDGFDSHRRTQAKEFTVIIWMVSP